MTKSTVAIIGRPNVGKSTLFNRLIGRRQALVNEVSGVTRDRIYGEVDWNGRTFHLIDTGGIDGATHSLSEAIRRQTLQAVNEADLLICLFDARDGFTTLDEELVAIARRADRPLLFAVNKVDTERQLDQVHAFAILGSQTVYPISAEHGRRIDDLLDAVVAVFAHRENARKPTRQTDGGEASVRVAIVGRPNVGKSSLVNRLVGSPRVVAHELPGTTRDAIDVELQHHGRTYTLVDTAGIRRRAKTDTGVETFSVIKALQTMERANVVILVIDAREGITHQDRQLAATIVKVYKPLCVAANKWDLVPKRQAKDRQQTLVRALKELARVPLEPISALTGSRCTTVLHRAMQLHKASHQRLKTAELNRVLQAVQAAHHLPSYRSQPLRLYYATQVATHPPSFTIFANYPAAIPTAYRRYLSKALEETLGMPGLPIRLIFRKRK